MNRLKQTTIETYNRRAPEPSEYFRGIGSRVDDINLVFDLLGNPLEPRIVEIGCGDGRDAKVITERTPNYLGIDISSGMIEVAQGQLPEASFMIADAADFEFPESIDAIFAFASLLHLDESEVKSVLGRAHIALKPGGIFYISLKHAEQYSSQIQKDQFGERQFFYYSVDSLKELAGDCYDVEFCEVIRKGNTDWIEMALRNKE